MRTISWSQALVIAVAVVAVAVLAGIGADTSALVSVIMTLFGSVLISDVRAIRKNTQKPETPEE